MKKELRIFLIILIGWLALLDFAILGSADNHMALAFIGSVDLSLNKKLHANYKLLCKLKKVIFLSAADKASKVLAKPLRKTSSLLRRPLSSPSKCRTHAPNCEDSISPKPFPDVYMGPLLVSITSLIAGSLMMRIIAWVPFCKQFLTSPPMS